MNPALIFAFISPLFFGAMNLLDKYIISRKVKTPLSFAFIAGMVNLVFGAILALFLDWPQAGFWEYAFPAIAGFLIGIQTLVYYYVMSKEDASNVIGFVYFYPVIVAMLSFLFLGEVLHFASYVGMMLVLIGIALLSIRATKLKMMVSFWSIFSLVVIAGLNEFFIKVATINFAVINSFSINMMFIGIAMIPILLHKEIRQGLIHERQNIKWALLTESFTIMGFLTLYLAMAGLPATIVSSVATIQPLAVLFFENMLYRRGVQICRDTKLLPKLTAILLIALGVALLYLPEL